MLPYLPLPLLGTVNFCDSWKLHCVKPTYCWINHGEAHKVNHCIVFASKSVLPTKCTHNPLWGVIMNSFDRQYHILAVSLVLYKICKI
jgi:hypothetical protein